MAEPPSSKRKGISRRSFMKGAGLSAAGATLLGTSAVDTAADSAGNHELRVHGPGRVTIVLDVNGEKTKLSVEPRMTLADALREELGLMGTKVSCNRGACSACTVIIDGKAVCSCMTLAIESGGKRITTIEGLGSSAGLHPVQEEFIRYDATQCGFCTPGMVMSCAALLARNPDPTREDVQVATSGNLCRCGAYPKVFEATLAAAQRVKKGR
jgi:xanthine dehydrogenase YagT iron-sulfur-binding subunit